MVLAASHSRPEVDAGLYILEPHTGAQPGMRVTERRARSHPLSPERQRRAARWSASAST